MSPQSRAWPNNFKNTTLSNTDDGLTGNTCSDTSSVAMSARAENMECALCEIDSQSSAAPANQDVSPSSKRPSSRISSSTKNQPYPSSLSGMSADIAQAPGDLFHLGSADGVVQTTITSSALCTKKARTIALKLTPQVALASIAKGTITEALSSTSNAPPRFNTSSQTIQCFNDQVRELQEKVFPSLHQPPITVSSCSFSTTSTPTFSSSCSYMNMEGLAVDGQDDSPSYGWFVFLDVDEGDPPDRREPSSASMFLPDSKPDLAFKRAIAQSAVNKELVVQQALAADTIHDVLGNPC